MAASRKRLLSRCMTHTIPNFFLERWNCHQRGITPISSLSLVTVYRDPIDCCLNMCPMEISMINFIPKPILLSWKRRVGICIGAARGLEFLRSGTPSIIHRDIKSSNFLLDKNWFPRISDFEMSRFVPTRSGTDSHVSTVVAGTMGYLDPEYVRTGHLTMKSDVYSFGVVLFEVLSARKPMERTIIQPTVMQRWRQCVEDDRIGEILDPRMKDEVAPECLTAYTNIAYKCVNNRGSERPTMADVVKRLEQILLFQECFEADVPFSPSWLGSIVPPPKKNEPLSETEFQVSDMSVSDNCFVIKKFL